MRIAARTDANQAEIVKALKQIGASVYYMKQPMDLLVGYRGTNFILECKVPGEKLNGLQEHFALRWCGSYHVVHSVAEALRAVLGDKVMA